MHDDVHPCYEHERYMKGCRGFFSDKQNLSINYAYLKEENKNFGFNVGQYEQISKHFAELQNRVTPSLSPRST